MSNFRFPYNLQKITDQLYELVTNQVEYAHLTDNQLIWLGGNGLIITVTVADVADPGSPAQLIVVSEYGQYRLEIAVAVDGTPTVKRYLPGAWEVQLKEVL